MNHKNLRSTCCIPIEGAFTFHPLSDMAIENNEEPHPLWDTCVALYAMAMRVEASLQRTYK